ncbi:MAG: undecaprenyl-diphosphate phosphatase [Acidimicrobiia bacterium]
MPVLHAIVLGIVQGLSEFLPISSSGHLKLVPWLFGWDDFRGQADLEQSFDVALHLGTLVGACAYFRRDIVNLARGALAVLGRDGRARLRAADAGAETGDGAGTGDRGAGTGDTGAGTGDTGAGTGDTGAGTGDTGAGTGDLGAGTGDGADPDLAVAVEGRLAWLLLASALPAALVGSVLNDTVAGLGDHEWLVAVMLVLFGGVLLLADRLLGRRPAESFRGRDALVMGAAQALALVPGVSRSGATITASRSIGFSRDAAARLSFLMSLPIIAGALLFEGVDMFRSGGIPEGFGPAFAWGIVASGVTGWLAVWGTLRFVRTHTFTPFVVYRVVAGGAVLLLIATGVR